MANLPFDIANFNLTNFANIYPDIMDSTPTYVSYQYKDENGNILTKDIANRGKFKQQLWDDVGGALGQLNLYFHVDAENGDDNNDGSSASPFKTIRKACNRIASKGSIYLAGNSDFIIDDDIDIANKYIRIVGSLLPTDTKPIIKNTSYTDNVGNATYGFIMQNSYLCFYTTTIQTANYTDSSQGNSYFQGIIKRKDGGGLGCVFCNSTTIKIGDTPFLRKSSRSFVDLIIDFRNRYYDEDYTIEQNGENVNGLLLTNEGSATFNFNFIGTVGKDKDGNDIVLKNLIIGIVKDADSGNPINVLSNINFSS